MEDVLITLKDISCVDLISYIIQAGIIAIGDDSLTLGFEFIEVVDDLRAKEGLSIGDGRLVDDDLSTFGLDALHDALDGALAEVIAVALHCQAIDANDATLFAMGIPLAAGLVIACLTEYLVGNEVLTGAVALYNGGHHVLGHIGIVGQQLFGVLRQTIAAIATS